MSDTPLVFITVGTDVHPFERLVRWTELLVGQRVADVVLQHGTSRPARGALNYDMLDEDGFVKYLDAADLVVAQGGPGGIFEARAHGRFPLVVPRSGDLGEHVDNHQQLFSALLAGQGLVRVVREQEDFVATVLEMLSTGAGTMPPDTGPASPFAPKLQDIVRQLRPLPWRTRVRRLVSSAQPGSAFHPELPTSGDGLRPAGNAPPGEPAGDSRTA